MIPMECTEVPSEKTSQHLDPLKPSTLNWLAVKADLQGLSRDLLQVSDLLAKIEKDCRILQLSLPVLEYQD